LTLYVDLHGKRVFATTGGKPFDRNKPVVLFLSGSALDHTFWALQSRFFAFRNYSVLVPDYPGHTNSQGPNLSSIESMADWVADLVETLDAKNLSVVGHSQGCLVALEFVSRHPDKIRSVSFIASGLATPVNPALIEAAEKNPDVAVSMMISWCFGEAGHKHQGAVPGNSMVAAGMKTMARNAPDSLLADLKACDAYENGKPAAEKIRRPKQVILGGKDRMAPRKAGVELAVHLANAEMHVIEHSGHMVPLEAPDECRTLLRDFIFANNPAT
jgi:pimeloyl-ACP methyl ester carboxylesterase